MLTTKLGVFVMVWYFILILKLWRYQRCNQNP